MSLPLTAVTEVAKPVSQQFPFLDLKLQFAAIREEILEAVERVLEQQHFILGPEVEKCETALAEFVGCRFAIACGSGSDALVLAMMALGIGPGDEVITVPFTFGATAGAIARLHAKPVFVDIDPETFNMAPEGIERALTSRTRAIMPVHLFGGMADMDAIGQIAADVNLPVIEDAAQAIGARWNGKAAGTCGTLGCFSFFPSKNLGCAGDGGAVTTNDPNLADRLRILRVHGSRSKYTYEMVGINSRLDALQAAILRIKLRHLGAWTHDRQRNAARYRELFAASGLEGTLRLPSPRPEQEHVYNQFVVGANKRDALRRHLSAAGIPTEVYYPHPLHLEKAFSGLGYTAGDFPQTEAACHEVLALPIFAELTEPQQRGVVSAIAEFYEQS